MLMVIGFIGLFVLLATDDPTRKGAKDMKQWQIVFLYILFTVISMAMFLVCVLVYMYRSLRNRVVTNNTEEVEILINQNTSYLPDDILSIVMEYAKTQRVCTICRDRFVQEFEIWMQILNCHDDDADWYLTERYMPNLPILSHDKADTVLDILLGRLNNEHDVERHICFLPIKYSRKMSSGIEPIYWAPDDVDLHHRHLENNVSIAPCPNARRYEFYYSGHGWTL